MTEIKKYQTMESDYHFLIHENKVYLPGLDRPYVFDSIGFHVEVGEASSRVYTIDVIMKNVAEYDLLVKNVKTKGIPYKEVRGDDWYDPSTTIHLSDYHITFLKDEYDIWKLTGKERTKP
jgi:hypothetical protein